MITVICCNLVCPKGKFIWLESSGYQLVDSLKDSEAEWKNAICPYCGTKNWFFVKYRREALPKEGVRPDDHGITEPPVAMIKGFMRSELR